jgi:hypothetical protein
VASALTAVQVEVLRRLRDGGDLFTGPPLPGLLGEVSFLLTMGLLELHGLLDVQLSGLGRAYLAAIEAESAPVVAATDPSRAPPRTGG